MPPVVAYAGSEGDREAYAREIPRAATAAGIGIELHMDHAAVDPAKVDFLVYARNGPVQDFAPFTGLKAILSLWAGVESILAANPPAEIPLVRMVEEGLTLSMLDYVVGNTMRHHLDIDRYINCSPIEVWEKTFPPLARERTVGVLGIGALGGTCAQRLAMNGFRVIGWSRAPKQIPGVECRHGDQALDETIAEAEILILLLPYTPETYRILNARRIAQMPLDACLINPGRGQLIDHMALLEALNAGLIRHATMDVFDVEPLPPNDPYWMHPRVTVTPHIASVTRPNTASDALVAQIARYLRGESFQHVVDRTWGY